MELAAEEERPAAFWDDESHRPGHQDIFVSPPREAGSPRPRAAGCSTPPRAIAASISAMPMRSSSRPPPKAIDAWPIARRSIGAARSRPVGGAERALGGGYRLRYAATGGGATSWRSKSPAGTGASGPARKAGGHRVRSQLSWLHRPGELRQRSRHPAIAPGRPQPGVRHVAGARDPVVGISRDLATLRAVLESPIGSLGPTRLPRHRRAGRLRRRCHRPASRLSRGGLELCRQNEILLIVDEVITGFGRSGAWFAFQRADGVRPDIVTMGKGITSAYFPLAAAAVAQDIHATFLAPGNAMSKIITMAGHPVGCDIALKVIEIMERDDLVGRVRQNEASICRACSRSFTAPAVRDVRGLGHMWGLEFGEGRPATGPQRRAGCGPMPEAGLLVLRADNMIRINPPLTATDEEMGFIAETLSCAAGAVDGQA